LQDKNSEVKHGCSGVVSTRKNKNTFACVHDVFNGVACSSPPRSASRAPGPVKEKKTSKHPEHARILRIPQAVKEDIRIGNTTGHAIFHKNKRTFP
jgi:hypothetical protein